MRQQFVMPDWGAIFAAERQAKARRRKAAAARRRERERAAKAIAKAKAKARRATALLAAREAAKAKRIAEREAAKRRKVAPGPVRRWITQAPEVCEPVETLPIIAALRVFPVPSVPDPLPSFPSVSQLMQRGNDPASVHCKAYELAAVANPAPRVYFMKGK